ncbi:MAG: PilZ domain-containing protein [Myxococcota bacterium]
MSERRAPRITAAIGVIVNDGKSRTACMTRTVSRTGMFLLTKERWDPTSMIELKVVHDEERFVTQARVVFATDEGVAVAFHDTSPEFTDAFGAFLSELVATPSSPPLLPSMTQLLWRVPSASEGHAAPKSSALKSVSFDGAAVDELHCPPIGHEVVVSVASEDARSAVPVECRAEVVRHTDSGFAIRFVDPSRRFRAALHQLRRASAPS